MARPQRRRQQDRALDPRPARPSAARGRCRTTSRAARRSGSPRRAASTDRGLDVVPLVRHRRRRRPRYVPAAELGTPGVEPQHGQVRPARAAATTPCAARGCPSSRRASAAGAGRRGWRPGRGPPAGPARRPGAARRRSCSVTGVRLAGRTVEARISITVALESRGRRGGAAPGCQHTVCQCRLEPSPSSFGHATTCGVAGRISWSQPGQRYAFVATAPGIGRTTQSPSGHSSIRSGPSGAAGAEGRGRRVLRGLTDIKPIGVLTASDCHYSDVPCGW